MCVEGWVDVTRSGSVSNIVGGVCVCVYVPAGGASGDASRSGRRMEEALYTPILSSHRDRWSLTEYLLPCRTIRWRLNP